MKGYSDCTAIVAASAVLPVPGNPTDVVRYYECPNNAIPHREAKLKRVVFVSMFVPALLAIFHVAGSTRGCHQINKTDNRSLDTP